MQEGVATKVIGAKVKVEHAEKSLAYSMGRGTKVERIER